MQLPMVTYFVYASVSIAMAVWVATTLHRNGRVFLVDAFHGNQAMADSVNHLLVVGFYLINLGFIALFLRFGAKPDTALEAVEYFSTKLGVVLLVLGAMHFFNMGNFSSMRSKARASEARERERQEERERSMARLAGQSPLPPARS